MTLNILIADDSATNRSLFTLTAARMGHHADAAASGREAIDFFNTHEYDLVFIDLHMPQMDGFALAATLTAQNTRRTPLYAMSGFIDGESETRLLAAGFYGWFIKPLDREKILRAAVEAGIAEKSAAEPENAADIPAKLLAIYARELRARRRLRTALAIGGSGGPPPRSPYAARAGRHAKNIRCRRRCRRH